MLFSLQLNNQLKENQYFAFLQSDGMLIIQ